MAISVDHAKSLDKFYSRPEAVQQLVELTETWMAMTGASIKDKIVIEPSAGAGAFLERLRQHKPKRLLAFDIFPEAENIELANFLDLSSKDIGADPSECLIVGNPPFGNKGRLAIDFLNHSLSLASTVVMIVPLIFRKWQTQRRIVADARLVGDFDLPEESFTLCGKPYKVRCCIQIWTLEGVELRGFEDLRIRKALPTSHPDFDCWQYNATKEALRYFDFPWDFGVLRQGYGDYRALITDRAELCDRKQWMFFKAKSPKILERLKAIDFEELSRTNTSVRGFGKTEIVARYRELYDKVARPTQSLAIQNYCKLRRGLAARADFCCDGREVESFDVIARNTLTGEVGFSALSEGYP